jgi:hypothetical protein
MTGQFFPIDQEHNFIYSKSATYKVNKPKPKPPKVYDNIESAAGHHSYRVVKKIEESPSKSIMAANVNKMNLHLQSCKYHKAVPTVSCKSALTMVLSTMSTSVNCPPFYAYVFPTRVNVHMLIPEAADTNAMSYFDKKCGKDIDCIKWSGPTVDANSHRIGNYVCIDDVLKNLNVSTHKHKLTGNTIYRRNKKSFILNIYSYGRQIVERAVSGIKEAVTYENRHDIKFYINNINSGSLDTNYGLQSLQIFPTDSNGVFYDVILNDVSCLYHEMKFNLNQIQKNSSIKVSNNDMQLIRSSLWRDSKCLPSLSNMM